MRNIHRRGVAALLSLGLVLGLFWVLAAPQVRAQASAVTIQNFAFAPPTVTVAVGTTITWTNLDAIPHTATSDNGVWDSGNLAQNASFSHTFNQAGTFTYYCRIHPYMKGTIVVQAPQQSPPPPPPPSIPTATATPTPIPTATPTPRPTSPPAKRPSHQAQKNILTAASRSTFVFKPVKTTVKVGTKVWWINRTKGVPHTVTSRTKGWKFNKQLGVGKKLSFVFRKPGTYKYVCTFHPGMRGTIVVKR